MAERLNKVVGLLEAGKVAFGPFISAGSIPDAVWAASSAYDVGVYKIEHSPFDASALRLSLQFILDRKQIAQSESIPPPVVPYVRNPINGCENNFLMPAPGHDPGGLQLGRPPGSSAGLLQVIEFGE